MNIKKENERLAHTLGFDCYYDLKTGAMRSRGGEVKDWIFTLLVLGNWAFRWVMWKAFYKMVVLKTTIDPDEGETMMEMYAKMTDLIEAGKK